MPDPEVILASPHGEGAKLNPTEYLGRPRFEAYRAAVSAAGARYVSSLKSNVITIDRLGALQVALAKAGFQLAVAAPLRRALEEVADELAGRAAAAEEVVEQVNAMLKERGLALYPYQEDGVRWLAPRTGALLGDEMGLGKTVEALLALPPRAPVLVVAPSAVAGNWLRECRKWRPDLAPDLSSGKARFRWPDPGELVVTTYGSMPMPDQEIMMPATGTVLIADEAHNLKGRPAKLKEDENGEMKWRGGVKRVAAWNGLRNAVLGPAQGRVWLLTGTPLVNRPPELWNVLRAADLAEEAFGSWGRFVSMFRGRKGQWGGHEWGKPTSDVPLALQKVMLRRERDAVLPDLPRKRRQVQAVSIDNTEAMELADEMAAALAEVGLTPDVLADLTGLARREREVIFERLSKLRAALAAAKIPVLLETLDEYEDAEVPVVVFSAHLAPLRAAAAREGWSLIVGEVGAEDRARIVEDFQAGRLKGVACSFAAGGVGITLTHAHHAVLVDLPWTPALLQQAEDRLCRIGQEADSVHVLILAGDHPVDLRVAEIQVEKAALIEATVNAAAVERVDVDQRIAQEADALAQLAQEGREAADAAEAEARRKAEARDDEERRQRDRARGIFEPGVETLSGFRPPANDEELWAAKSLVTLARLDPDYAAERNNEGFNAMDGSFGHSLASQLVQYGRLSDKQWGAAIKIAMRYPRQVGRPS